MAASKQTVNVLTMPRGLQNGADDGGVEPLVRRAADGCCDMAPVGAVERHRPKPITDDFLKLLEYSLARDWRKPGTWPWARVA